MGDVPAAKGPCRLLRSKWDIKLCVCMHLWITAVVCSAVKETYSSGVTAEGGKICRSMDIRNKVQALQRLSGCRVVEGSVRVVLIDWANETDYDRFSFPELREITDYLLVYRVTGLTNLGTLFPNLTVIRGNSLFVDYALVVYEMFQLKEIGLRSLTTILRGSVRIEKNQDLCYVDTVDWSSILHNGESFAASNKEGVLCPRCPASCESFNCWGPRVCQNLRINESNCHELCLGGCSGPGPDQCSACTRVVDEHGVCVNNCPPDRFEFVGRRCMTEEECRKSIVPPPYLQRGLRAGLPSKAWIPFNGTCSLTCPQGYQASTNNSGKQGCEPCVGHCRKVCGNGSRIPIENIYDIQSLNGCTYINGSLAIHLMGSKVLEELENNFDAIEEISGYLKISLSYPLVTLNFFKNLRMIHGKQLESDQFALVIVGNDNLQELWNWDSRPRNFTIEKGTLSLHSNPKLCISEIDKLRYIANLHNDTADEISYESNGNEVTCIVIKMNASSMVINSTSVTIQWDPFHVPRGRGTLLGYTVHYMETDVSNVTLQTDHDECGVDNWRVAYVVLIQSTTTGRMSHNVTHLKPFTQYAYYVKTYATASATEEGRSSIQYFRTYPDRPSIPRYLRASSNSSSEIVLQWQPPLFPNGEISHYIIVGWRHYDDAKLLDQRDYCRTPLEYHKEEEGVGEDLFLLSEPLPRNSCCEPVSRETCISNDDSKFNFIYTQEAINEEQDSCDQQTSIYSVLYSHRLYGNGGGIYDSVDLADGHFVQRSDGNTTIAVLRDLHHFSKYTIKVVACRKNRFGGVDLDWNDRHCSPSSLITARTQKFEAADHIDSSFVKVTVESGTVRVFWLEPPNPNGVIVSYHVEYRRTDIVNIKPIVVCVAKLQFEKAKNWFVLNSVAPGKYSLRVKATSLAGESKYTHVFEFKVKREFMAPTRRSEIFVLLSVIIASVILLFCVFFLLWRKTKAGSTTIVTSANPEYVSLAIYEPDEWEIVRDKVELIRELNKGSFGIVYEGILWPANIRCAVKTVDEKATVRERVEFLTEASVMKSFAGGHHVVRLLGVVSRGQPPLVVMELMALGDLKSFLRETRNMDQSPINLPCILLMAAQIADGMAYLEASKFVHRDLAARNCMLTDNLTVKIGDFGMARDVYEKDYYRKGNKGLLPIRWMAPESLADGIFSNQSDVWSYGVVLWEISTLAEQPYQGLANEQVLQFVIRGEILEKPELCPDILYSLMLACWQKRPVNRPSFLRLVRIIDAVTEVGDEFRQTSFYHSHAGQDLRSKWCQQGTKSSSAEDSFQDENSSETCETCERLDFSLLNSEFNSDVPEIRTTSSGLDFNMETLSHNNCSSTAEPQYLNMSKRTSRHAADEYVLGDFGS